MVRRVLICSVNSHLSLWQSSLFPIFLLVCSVNFTFSRFSWVLKVTLGDIKLNSKCVPKRESKQFPSVRAHTYSHPWLAGLAAPVGSPEVTDTPTNPHCWLVNVCLRSGWVIRSVQVESPLTITRGPNLHPGKRWPISCHHLWVWSTTSWDPTGAAKSANPGWFLFQRKRCISEGELPSVWSHVYSWWYQYMPKPLHLSCRLLGKA